MKLGDVGKLTAYGIAIRGGWSRDGKVLAQVPPPESNFGCYDLALAHERGLGVAVNRARAVDLYRQGCHAGSAWACKQLTRLGAHP